MWMTPDSSLALGLVFVQEPQSMAVPAMSMLRKWSYSQRFTAEFYPPFLKESLKTLWLPASVFFFIFTASLASCKDGKCLLSGLINKGMLCLSGGFFPCFFPSIMFSDLDKMVFFSIALANTWAYVVICWWCYLSNGNLFVFFSPSS